MSPFGEPVPSAGRRWGLVALATAAGLGLAWCFPPHVPNPIVGFCLFTVGLWSIALLGGRFVWLAGFSFGMGFFVPLLSWLDVVGVDAWIALSILCALWWMLPIALLSHRTANAWWPLQFALLWGAIDIVRSNFPWGGFGWGSLSLLLLDSPLESLIPFVGQLGGTFVIALAACGLVAALNRKGPAIRRTSVVLVALLGTAMLPSLSDISHPVGSARVGMVQGNAASYGLGFVGDPRLTLAMHIETTQQHLTELNETDLVIWPESSLQYDINVDRPTRDAVVALRKQLRPDLLVNMVAERSDGTIGNAAVLIGASGWQEVYAKRHLVPFGEFLPMRSVISKYTSRAALLSQDFAPGRRAGVVTAGQLDLNLLICFEIQDEGLALSDPATSSAYVVQTNNATYQFGAESEQQLQYARFRARETNRPVLVVSTSGISAVVDPQGRIQQHIDKGESDVMIANLHATQGRTSAMTTYATVHTAMLVGGAVVLISQFMRRRKIRV